MNEQMKKISRGMSIRMGLAMSLCMSLIGTLTSGHFTPMGFLMGFVVSFIVSLLIGFVVPVGKISRDFTVKRNMQPGKISTRLTESMISNLVYTPVMTLVMVALAYFMAMKQSGGMAQISFWPMFLRSLLICFIAGYVLIFLIQPVFFNSLMRKYGIGQGQHVDKDN